MEDYYEYLDSNGVTTLYKLIKDDTVALIDSYSVTINGITTTLDTHVNNTDIHTPIADIESMVDTKISGLVNSAPETLDTLKELSDALGADPNFATTVANQIGNKANKDSVYTKEETDTLLEGKANSVHSHVVSDITDFPTIPTKTSELSNDSNFVTSTELHDYATKNDLNSKQDALSEEQLSNIDSIPDKANKSDLSTVATSGSYKDLLDKPVIPEGADLSDYYNKGETDNLLNSKANTSDLAVVAKSGNYNDLNNTPTIPTKLSQLENDMGFGSGSGGVITSVSWTNITDKPNFATVATSGSYTDLSNTPTIPTKVSQLENDMGFGTGGDTSDCVHKTGNETIGGNKAFTNTIFRKADITTIFGDIVYRFEDSNNSPCGYIQNNVHYWQNHLHNRHLAHNNTSGKEIYLDVISRNNGAGIVNIGGDVTSIDNISGVSSDTNSATVATMGWVNNPATSTNVVHRSGDETIAGAKTFTNDIYSKNNFADLSVTPTEYHANHNYIFTDKNNVLMGRIEYCQRPTGVNDIGIFARDKNGVFHGIHINTSNEVIPLMSSSESYSLGSSSYKWGKIYSDDIVHTTGDETITGFKSFTEVLDRRNDVTISTVATATQLVDTNANRCGWIANRMHWSGNWHVHNRHIAYNENSGKEVYIDIISSNDGSGGLFVGGSATNRNLNDVTSEIGHTALATMGWVNNPAASTNVVHRSGDETIAGIKTFSERVYFPSGYFIITDTNDNSLRIVRDGTGHGNNYKVIIQGDTGKFFAPNGFIGNLQGNADTATSATYATTQATTDNSTRIATTAWVRNYVNSVAGRYSVVNSVAGSNAVGSSVSAYWSNSSNVTATGQSSSGEKYPACYSEYITKTPTVDTIYSGAQLYTVLNTYASANASTTGQGGSIKVTNITAQATFSNPISSTGKYLCTTANTVKFRAYVTAGSSSSLGTASVVDNSSTKSIFIRVE